MARVSNKSFQKSLVTSLCVMGGQEILPQVPTLLHCIASSRLVAVVRCSLSMIQSFDGKVGRTFIHEETSLFVTEDGTRRLSGAMRTTETPFNEISSVVFSLSP